MTHEHKNKAQRLERILRLERLKGQRIENELAAVEARRQQNAQYESMLNETLGAGVAAQPGANGPAQATSIEDLKRRRQYLDTLSATLDVVTAERDRIDQALERSRHAWTQQRRRSEAIEDLSRRAHDAHARAEALQEELEIDDLSATRHSVPTAEG